MIGVYFGFYDLYSFPPAQFPKYCPDLNSFFLIKYFPSVFWGKHYSEDAESELKRGEKIGNLRGGMRGAIRKRFSANSLNRQQNREINSDILSIKEQNLINTLLWYIIDIISVQTIFHHFAERCNIFRIKTFNIEIAVGIDCKNRGCFAVLDLIVLIFSLASNDALIGGATKL